MTWGYPEREQISRESYAILKLLKARINAVQVMRICQMFFYTYICIASQREKPSLWFKTFLWRCVIVKTEGCVLTVVCVSLGMPTAAVVVNIKNCDWKYQCKRGKTWKKASQCHCWAVLTLGKKSEDNFGGHNIARLTFSREIYYSFTALMADVQQKIILM